MKNSPAIPPIPAHHVGTPEKHSPTQPNHGENHVRSPEQIVVGGRYNMNSEGTTHLGRYIGILEVVALQIPGKPNRFEAKHIGGMLQGVSQYSLADLGIIPDENGLYKTTAYLTIAEKVELQKPIAI